MERITGLPALLFHRRLTRAFLVVVLATMTAIAPVTARSAGALEQQRLAPCDAVANRITGASASDQLITVVASTARSQTATLDLFVRRGGCLRLVDGPYSAHVGRNGLSAHHVEGDGTTPMGLFGFQSTMYGVLANPSVAFAYHRLVCGDWWDEQSTSALYNHFVHVACGTQAPFGGDAEALWQIVPNYDYFAVIAYNRHPIVPGRGSGIFLHVSDGRPTVGCVSLPADELLRILRALRPNLRPLIDITTRQLLGS